MNDRQRKSGCILFKKVDNEYELLLVKQKDIWSFPKGSVDHGETVERAAQRELFEETSLNFILDKFVNLELIYHQSFFLFDCTDLDINFKISRPKEISDIKWFRIDELVDINVNSFLRRFLFKREYFESKFKIE